MAIRTLRREWRAGELRVLAAALAVSVAAMSAVGVFTDRMDRAMAMGASELLAADLVVVSHTPLDDAYVEAARERGLHVANTLTFRSVAVVGERFQLAQAKAVDDGYPLRGVVRTAATPFGPDAPATGAPAPGTVWVEARLLALLGVAVGDSLALGASRLTIARVVSYEPDRGGELFSIAPRIMLNLADVPATGLVQPASRVRYHLLFAGPEPAVTAMRAWLAGRIAPNQELQGVRDARPELRAALERADRFLGLAALVSVLLAGAAVAVGSRRHAARHLDPVAVMRCLGASQRMVVRVYGLELLLLGLGASLAGCALGYLAQLGLGNLVGTMMLAALPPPSLMPIVWGLAIGLVTLAGFGLPPLLRLRDVSPARVLRRDLGAAPGRSYGAYAAATVALTGLVVWQARDLKLAAFVLGGGAATLAALAAAAWLAIRLLDRLRSRVGVAWRYGLANIVRRPGASTLQVVAFGVGIMVLLLLTLVRGGLLDAWRADLPLDTPNYFLVNVQPDDVAALSEFLGARAVDPTGLYPMVRGRLTEINGTAVKPEDFAGPHAQRLAARDFNLSFTATMAADNRLVAGRWDAGEDGISVEEGLAERLGLVLGDRLAFQVAGEKVDGVITSLRAVEWDSFRVNFFVIFTPQRLAAMPATYITAFHLPAAQRDALVDLVRRFPSVTVIDVDALLGKIREIMDRATLAIEYVFGFTVLAGLMVLLAAIQSTVDERRFETAVLRTLGADRRRLLQGLAAEFALLGALAGGLAALAATVIAMVVADRLFGLAYGIDPLVWVVGLVGGAAGVAAAGLAGTRSVLEQPPADTLRSG